MGAVVSVDGPNPLLLVRPTFTWYMTGDTIRVSNPERVSTVFIAQLLTIGEPGPDLTVLEWFPIEFGDSSCYYGFGCTRQELELPENARARQFVRIGMDRHMDICLPSEERHEDAY